MPRESMRLLVLHLMSEMMLLILMSLSKSIKSKFMGCLRLLGVGI